MSGVALAGGEVGMVRAYRPVAAVLLDVGGTLWPERWPDPAGDAALRAARLR